MDQAQRGREARAILGNSIVQEALAHIDAECIKRWRETTAGEVEEREEAYRMLRVAQMFRQFFTNCIAGGQKAEAEDLRVQKRTSR